MKTKRILSWLLILLLLLGGMIPKLAAVQAAETEIVVVESNTVTAGTQTDSSQMFELYLKRLFYPAPAAGIQGESGGNRLGARPRALYDFLKSNLLSVSSGASASTAFSLSAEQISAWGGTVSFTRGESQSVEEAAGAALTSFANEFEVEKVLTALLYDCPYELYWYDKVTGTKYAGSFSLNSTSCRISAVEFRFAVVEDLRGENYDSSAPTFDTTAVSTAAAAADRAKALVAQYANESDADKLLAYRQEICALVSYDDAAAESGDFSTDADPWQLIHVFDGDIRTNVVCEGYSKAFQYLTELSDFRGDIDCISVSGTMSGEPHMWNIVSIGGNNYLTDITNSDTGAVGEDGSLFLAGASGTISDGYQIEGLYYIYDSRMLALWGTEDDSRLRISPDKFSNCELGHTEVTDKAVPPTCTEAGLTEGTHCSVCGLVLQAQQTIPALGHTEVTDKAVPPTCTEAGLTEGTHCSVCGLVLQAQQAVPALGHTEVTDKAVPPTCTEAGLTEGTHCSVCGLVLQAQQTIPALGHTEVTDKAVPPTCTEAGLTEGTHCSVCGLVLQAQQTIPALGHTEVTDKAVPPTCTEAGLTEGTHCSVCGLVLKAQQAIPALGHTEVTDKAVPPTCTEAGLTEGTHCSVCGLVLKAQQAIPALGHTEVTDKAVSPTCTEAGLTEGTHCSVCGLVLKVQQEVPALGHSWMDASCTAPKTCRVCHLQEGKPRDHVFRDDWDTDCEQCGHERKPVITLSPMYRLYNPFTQEHLLTGSEAEKDQLVAIGWHLDGVAWKSPSRGDPVYRLYNPYDDWHTYTMSQEEIDMLVPLGWKVDGVICYSAIGRQDTPIFRLFNPYAPINYHLLTASEEESSWLVSLGWILEGVGWYGVR